MIPAIGIRLHGGQTAASALGMAHAAEAAGFSSLWFAENAYARGILPLAAACAASTARIQIGAGVFNPYTRHPSMMAMEAGALDEISGGRCTIGVGAGIAAAARLLGLDADKPVGALRDTLVILRGLLKGERVTHAGRWFSANGVALDYATRADLPIFLAGRGPLTIRLAGELADGLIVSNMCSAGFTAAAADRLHASHAAAGRAGQPRIIQYMPCIVDDDPAHALSRAKQAVAAMLPGYWSLGQRVPSARNGLLAGTGITEAEFAAAAACLGAGDAADSALDERFATSFTLWGSAARCLQQAARYRATDLALTFTGPHAFAEIAALGAALRDNGRNPL